MPGSDIPEGGWKRNARLRHGPPDPALGNLAEQRMRPPRAQLAEVLRPLAHDLAEPDLDPRRARPAALAAVHAHGARVEVDVLRAKRERLSDPEARPVQQRDQRAVAQAGRRAPAARADRASDQRGIVRDGPGGVPRIGLPSVSPAQRRGQEDRMERTERVSRRAVLAGSLGLLAAQSCRAPRRPEGVDPALSKAT